MLQSDVHLMKCSKNIIYAIMQYIVSSVDYVFQHQICVYSE
jgi:hypothetical protein